MNSLCVVIAAWMNASQCSTYLFFMELDVFKIYATYFLMELDI